MSSLLHVNNLRINSPVHRYPIGTIVDDQQIIGYQFRKRIGYVFECRCLKCGRTKVMIACCLDTHKGTTHMACGQYMKHTTGQFYKKWQGMKHRIYNENYWAYHRYGGRGLTCDYDVFVDFYDDMYQSYLEHVAIYGEKNTELDRICNDKGYVRGNLRWATRKEQVNNSTKMGYPFLAYGPNGEVEIGINQSDFAKEHGLSDKQINAVLNRRFNSTRNWMMHYISPEDYPTLQAMLPPYSLF